MTNEWINEELENAQKEKEARGFKEFVKFPEGVTKLEINLDEKPRNTISQLSGKPQKILTVRKEHTEGEFNYGIHPFMLERLLKKLVDAGLNEGWAKVQVIRTGTLMKTRYTFKAGWE